MFQLIAMSCCRQKIQGFYFRWDFLTVVLALTVSLLVAESPESPHLTSVFPLGGPRGGQVEVEVRGHTLDGAYAVWFDGRGLQANVLKVEKIKSSVGERGKQNGATSTEDNRQGYRVRLHVSINNSAVPAVYVLRLVSPRGISNPLPFIVHSDSIVLEATSNHDTPNQAQRLSFPTVLHGRISSKGELDYYSFDALKNQTVFFEVFSSPVGVSAGASIPFNKHVGSGFDARLGLYEDRGSWLDPNRVRSLALSDEPVFSSIDPNPRLIYQFKEDGRYILEVGAFSGSGQPPPMGFGGPDHVYLLRIASDGASSISDRAKDSWQTLLARSDWREQTFERPLRPDRLVKLQERSNHTVQKSLPTVLPSIDIQEIDDEADQWPEIRPLNLLRGTIDKAGDVDNFQLRIEKTDQPLVFEIETPSFSPPRFNPWLIVRDQEGKEVFSNIYVSPGRIPHYRKTVRPKTIHSFKTSGVYHLQIRDITNRFGGPGFQYKLLIRPLIPHVGEMEVSEELSPGVLTSLDRLNLLPGHSKKLTISVALEEGLAANVGVIAEGLPAGVKVYPALESEPNPVELGGGANLDDSDREKYIPRTRKTNIVLAANPDATYNETLHWIHFAISFVPTSGPILRVKGIPLMVSRSPIGKGKKQ